MVEVLHSESIWIYLAFTSLLVKIFNILDLLCKHKSTYTQDFPMHGLYFLPYLFYPIRIYLARSGYIPWTHG